MVDKELLKKQELESFLQSQLFEESQTQTIPQGYETIEKYPLYPPFSYANILYNREKANYLYFVDELRLTQEEERIFENLRDLIEASLESPDITDSNNFESHLNSILEKHEKMFFANSTASIEKVKYYLQRDINGFGLIDPLMHDVNIEDISCSGTDKSIYVWHRKYDSVPTSVQFLSEEKLNSFISRIVFRAGKHISSAFPITDLADRKSTRLNSSHIQKSRMPSSA